MSENRVIALYDFRSKQEYIYRTNPIKEIVGASNLITSAYDKFLKRLLKHGINIQKNFDFEDGIYKNCNNDLLPYDADCDFDGKVIYVGGGNLQILFRNNQIYILSNQIFSKMLLEETYSLQLICSCAPFTGDYKNDQSVLFSNNMKAKNMGRITVPTAILPFTELDRKTSLPIASKKPALQQSLSKESVHKYNEYKRCAKTLQFANSEKNLDSLMPKERDESLLAIIYIDGNGLGEKIKNLLENCTDYNKCSEEIRSFSNSIQKNYVTNPIDKIDKCTHLIYRKVIGGGDEITIICNARDVLQILEVYFKSLSDEEGDHTACAGVAIFHSHAPFSIVYKIAEECCENGKKINRANGNNNCFVDFHYCYSGLTNSLDNLREKQEKNYTARPYCYTKGSANNVNMFTDFLKVGKDLKNIGRGNAKSLGNALFRGESYFLMELNRINCRKKTELKPEDKKLIFDASMMYDLWFDKEGGNSSV